MKDRVLLIVFSLVLFSDLLVIGTDLPLQFRYLSKPAITIVLILYALNSLKQWKWLRFFLVAALVFSLTGDIFLLLPSEVNSYFIGGLLAFLMAHLMYITAFFNLKRFRTTKTFFATLLLLFYSLVVFKFIGSNLGALYPYVVLYMVVLLLMVLTAFVRSHSTSARSYTSVLTGALLFMISDTILALNKFYQPFAYADILIMLTYGAAQFLIIYGASQQKYPSSK